MVTPSEVKRELAIKRATRGVTPGEARREKEHRERQEKPPEPTPAQVAIAEAYEKKESEYSPSSTMYKMGFRTKEEYSEAQRAGVTYGKHEGELVPKESVIVTTTGVYEGDRPISVRYSGETAEKHPDLSRAVLGAIRRGTYKVPVTDLKGRTRYLPPEEAEEALKEIKAKWAVATKVVDTRAVEIAKFEQSHTQVGTDQWIKNTELVKLEKDDPEGYTILTEKGFDAYNKLFEQRQVEIEKFERLNVKLPDGDWINKADLVEIKHDDPKAYEALTSKGYSAYENLIDARRIRQDRMTAVLAPYTTQEGTDVAKYLRDNQKYSEVAENSLTDYGFTGKDIKEATDQNKKYYGIGAPRYIDTDIFMRQYFKDRGWDWTAERKKATLANATLSQLDSYSQKMKSAKDAHDMQFKAPLAPAQFQELYFKDKGWKYDINRADVTETEATQHSMRVREANKLYTSKYGEKAIFEAGMGKMADFIPFVELRHWEKMSPVERGVNLGIDIAFTALIFSRPLSSVARNILKRAFGNRGLKTIETTIKDLATAINTGNPRQIERAAYRVSNYGEMMHATGISGGQELAVRANAIARNAKVIATLSNEVSPGQVRTMLKQMGKGLKEIHASQIGNVRLDPLPAKKLTKEGIKTVVAPITRSEARGFGLSEADVDAIFNLVGENRARFLIEAQRIVRLRNEALFDQINAFVRASGGLKSKPMTYVPPAKKPPIIIKEIKPVEKHIAEDIWKSFDKQREAIRKATKQKITEAKHDEYIRQLAAITEKAEASIKKTLAELTKKRKATTVEAFALGIPGRLTFAKMQELLNDWAKMKPGYAADQLAKYDLATLAIATNAEQMAKVLANVSAQTRGETLAKVDAQIKHALGLGNLAQAQTLAKALTMAQSKTKALAMAKSMTDALAYAKTLGLVETKGKVLALAKVVPAVKAKTILAPAPKVKPVTKVAIKPPISVKAIITPPLKGVVPRPIKPLKPAPAKPVKPKPIKPVKPIIPLIPIIPTLGGIREKYKKGEIPGYITFNMGWQRYGIVPPYTQAGLINLGKIVDRYNAGRTAQETLKIVGKVPASISFDLGVTDGWINTRDKIISFGGRGETTNVGDRIESTTKGLSMPARKTGEFLPDIETEGISRPAIARRRPKSKRKGKRLTDYEYMTTVKGFRP